MYLRVWGEELPAGSAGSDPPACPTANRVLVYAAGSGRLVRAVCPTGGGVVQLFTDEWWGRGGALPAALLVVWAAREPGVARFAWMEVWRARAGAAAGPGGDNATAGCSHACGALHACMAAALWCDGGADCPGGADEAGGCGAGARLLAALGAGGVAGAAGGACALALLAALLAAAFRRRRAARHDKRLLGALAAGRRLTEELLYDASRASSAASS